jgi:hypothetical protein
MVRARCEALVGRRVGLFLRVNPILDYILTIERDYRKLFMNMNLAVIMDRGTSITKQDSMSFGEGLGASIITTPALGVLYPDLI